MNKELSTILKGKLQSLPFIGLLGGMVQTVTTQDAGENGEVIIKRFPVSYDHNDEACQGAEVRFIPDDRHRSIIYFEDFGISSPGRGHAGLMAYKSNIRLVCWMNRAKLVGDNYAEISGRAMAEVVNKLVPGNPQNAGMFVRLKTRVASIPPQDAGIFGRYTYSEPERQYLRPPFEFFGIDFSLEYEVKNACLEGITWNTEICY